MTARFETEPVLGPKKFQGHRPGKVTAIVLHGAGDFDRSDGAVGLAEQFRTTSRHVSTHSVVDHIEAIKLLPYQWVAFHALHMNPRSIGITLATNDDDWTEKPIEWQRGIIDTTCEEIYRAAAWMKSTYGIFVPPIQLTGEQARAGAAGIVGSSELYSVLKGPGPLPWAELLDRYKRLLRKRQAQHVPDVETVEDGTVESSSPDAKEPNP